LCSGKLYYDLYQQREYNQQTDQVAIVRIEELYPFPSKAMQAILRSYKNTNALYWCQEEPKNQGSWYFIKSYLYPLLKKSQTLQYIGRNPSASPAVGLARIHAQQQKEIVAKALSL
jgi:2-oxoglutarate dehydrogenase E1 component